MPSPGAAFDAMPDDTDPSDVIEFLDGKIDDADLATVKKMLGMADDADASGASDARRRAAVPAVKAPKPSFPHANRLK